MFTIDNAVLGSEPRKTVPSIQIVDVSLSINLDYALPVDYVQQHFVQSISDSKQVCMEEKSQTHVLTCYPSNCEYSKAFKDEGIIKMCKSKRRWVIVSPQLDEVTVNKSSRSSSNNLNSH